MNVTDGSGLGMDAFLQLFSNQLKYQDPLQPMQSSEFTSQLAQFSSLEQLTDLNSNFKGLLALETSLNNGMAAGFIGKTVTTVDGITGRVTGVSFSGGSTYLLLDSGDKVSLGQIQEIHEST